MTSVILSGWKLGMQKIPLTKLLVARAGLGLKDAKDCVDRCVDGETVLIGMPSVAAAEELAREASALGAVAGLEPVERQRS